MLFRGIVRLSALAGVLLLSCSAVEAARLSAPSNITTTGVSDRAIEITWTTSQPNLVGFSIERSQPGRRRRFKTIATINDGSARRYEDQGLQSDTTYYYRMRALQEKRSRSGKLRKPKKSRKSKPVEGTTLAEKSPTPQPTATAGGPPPPPPSGGDGSPWISSFGSDETEIGTGVAVDAGQNVAVTGRFMDRVDFGGGRLTSRGGFDVFVARYAPDGTHLWSRAIGGSLGDDGRGVAVDAAGNVLVTGFFRGSMNAGGGTLASAGQSDIFLAKYSVDGDHLWSKRFGGAGSDIGYAVATDGADNIVVVGTFHGNVSFGGAPLVPSQYSPVDLFVAKYSPTGQHLWSRNYTSGGTAAAHAVAVAPDGTLAIAGVFAGSLDFGGNTMRSVNFTDDVFVAKLAADGTHLWSRDFGSTNSDYGTGVAMDANGDVLVTGTFRHTVDFGGGALPDSGLGDVFVAKYASANGAHRWSRHGGSFVETDAGTAIALDADGNPSVTGWFKGIASFNGTALTSVNGSGDAFLAQYSANGTLRSVEAFGGSGDDLGNGVAVSPAGLVVATGAFSRTGSFRGTTRTSAGGHDAYLVQLAD